ncbi:MAG: hypothetical protein WAN35_17470 [Terracidiphilus sp.]
MTEKRLSSGNEDAAARSRQLVEKIQMRLKEQALLRSDAEQMRLKVKEAIHQRGGSGVVNHWLNKEEGRHA